MSSSRIVTNIAQDTVPRDDRDLQLFEQPATTFVPLRNQASILSYLEVPFIHKKLVLACVLFGLVVGWLAILLWPRSYQSVAKLMIKVGRESVSLDPTASVGSNILTLHRTQEEEIISTLEVLNSRAVTERVVDTLGERAILDGELPPTDPEQPVSPEDSGSSRQTQGVTKSLKRLLGQLLYATGVKDDISDHEMAIRKVQSSLNITSPKSSSVLVIDGRAKTPEMAQAIVQEITDSYLKEHLQGSRTDGSYQFFVEQSSELESELQRLIAERAIFMKENQILSLERNREMLSLQFSDLDRDLAIALGQLRQSEAEAQDLETQLLELEDEVVTERTVNGDLTWSGMRQRVYELELEERDLAARSGAEHPELKLLREQLEGARRILNQLESKETNERTQLNPIKMVLKENRLETQTKVSGLQSLIREKQEQRRSLEDQAGRLLDFERYMSELDREIEQTTSNLTNLQERMEEARVIEELNTDEISNVHVFQPATFEERAVSPDKKLLGTALLLFGLVSGLALAFLREGFSPVLRTSRDVETQIGAPVIASLPRLTNVYSPSIKEQLLYRQECVKLLQEIVMNWSESGKGGGQTLGILGVEDGVGASTLAANLAMAASNDCGLKTILIDADLRQRTTTEMFGHEAQPSLSELIDGTASHDECLRPVDGMSFKLIAAARGRDEDVASQDASSILQSLEAYRAEFDLLILDLPASNAPNQSASLAQQLDSIVVVAESEKTKFRAVDRLLNRLILSKSDVLGVALNKRHSYLPRIIRRFASMSEC